MIWANLRWSESPAMPKIQVLLHQPGPSLQDRGDGLAVAVLEGHGDEVGRPVRPGPPRLDHGLHADVDGPALERLHQVVEVIDLPFREDDEHLPPPHHHLDGVAFRLLVVQAAAFDREGPEPLEPPARDPVALVERLAVHHEEEPAARSGGTVPGRP